MKCTKCGANLADGVLFCRECGAKIEQQKRFCRDCGAEVSPGARFCSSCGANLSDVPTPEQMETDTGDISPTEGNCEPEDNTPDIPGTDATNSSTRDTGAVTFGDKIKSKIGKLWNGLDFFCKVVTIAAIVTLLLLLIAFVSHNTFAICFSVIQIAGLVFSTLWHKGILDSSKKWLKYIVLVATILFAVLNVMSYSWGKKNVEKPIVPASPVVPTEAIDAPITPPYSAADCVGRDYKTIRDEFASAGFTKINTDKIGDLSYSESDRIDTIESVTIGGVADFTEVQEFSKDDMVDILYHVYEKVTVTIDVDFMSNLFFDKYDVVLYLNDNKIGELAHGEDKSFSQEVDPGTYTLTFRNKDDKACVGTLDLDVKGDVNASVQIYCHSDNIRVETLYIEKLGEVREGEIMMPQNASSFIHKNYLDVQRALEDLGFTNISTEILYDIVFGWTDEGETERVSIDGNASYTRGDIFRADAPVIITYHMKQEDDPARATETTSPPETTTLPETTSPTETPKTETYAVDKDLVVTKCEQDAKYTTMYHIAFAEVDANGNQIREYAFGHCINPRAMGNKFNAIGGLPTWFYVGATVHVKANFGYDGLYETDTTVTEATGSETAETTPTDAKPTVVLPDPSSKLGKDFDSKSSSTVYYINVDGVRNKPTIKRWNGATVTDGVAEYLDTLKSQGFNVRITSQNSKTPYEGFTYYETYFEVSNNDLKWTMYLNIQSEKYVEYELDIHLD